MGSGDKRSTRRRKEDVFHHNPVVSARPMRPSLAQTRGGTVGEDVQAESIVSRSSTLSSLPTLSKKGSSMPE